MLVKSGANSYTCDTKLAIVFNSCDQSIFLYSFTSKSSGIKGATASKLNAVPTKTVPKFFNKSMSESMTRTSSIASTCEGVSFVKSVFSKSKPFVA